MHDSTLRLYNDIAAVFSKIKSSMTVRQVYYQLVGLGHPKTDEFYGKQQRALLDMRRGGLLPYQLITDGSRYVMKPRSYGTVEEAISMSLDNFRLDVWSQINHYVEVWMEKTALASIFYEVTSEFNIPLFVSRGFSSESFIYSSSENIKNIGKPATILLFTDYDPSGLTLSDSIVKGLERFGCQATFKRCCLTPEQIVQYELPSRPTKESSHSRNFTGDSTDMDALNPNDLKSIIRGELIRFIPEDLLETIKVEEETLRATKFKLLR